MPRGQHRRSAVIAAFAVLLMGAGATAALATENEPPAGVLPDVANPDGLINDVHEELQYLREHPSFGSFRLELAKNVLHLHWSGEMPDELLSKAAVSAAARGVTLDVHTATYTASELDEATKIATQIIDKYQLPVTTVGPEGDTSGLGATINLLGKNSTPETREQARELLTAGLDVPIEFKEVEDIDSHNGPHTLATPPIS